MLRKQEPISKSFSSLKEWKGGREEEGRERSRMKKRKEEKEGDRGKPGGGKGERKSHVLSPQDKTLHMLTTTN